MEYRQLLHAIFSVISKMITCFLQCDIDNYYMVCFSVEYQQLLPKFFSVEYQQLLPRFFSVEYRQLLHVFQWNIDNYYILSISIACLAVYCSE